MERIDFTACPKIPGRAYNGANGKKIAVEYKGNQYMLKFPPSGGRKPTTLSYTNSCISEHIASSLFNLLGVKAQETLLGTYQVGTKKKVVCACKDFTAGGKRFFDFCSIKNTILDSESDGNGTELPDILEALEKQQYVDPAMLTKHFWDVFVIDALLGNFDRHNGNWGFLYDDASGQSYVAPVFDCGSCLLPQADEKVMKEVLADEDALNARVYQFPTSAIKQNGRKINYYDFLTSMEYEDCKEAIRRIVPRIGMEQIRAFLGGVPYISDLQKEFYGRYIEARCDKILKPVLDMVSPEEQETAGPTLSLQQKT
ncbi:CtkA family protein [Eubacterium sp. AM05-23]|nr:CtkA family protein [Eubacterium sp. AM05-23]